MQRLLSADESSFERQMALRKTKGALEDMLGVEGEEETKFFDNGVELAAHKGTKMVLARWKDGQLDLDNAHLLSIGEGGEAGSRTCLSQLTSHTLIIKSKDCYHSYYLLKEHHHLQLVHLFTLQALVPPRIRLQRILVDNTQSPAGFNLHQLQRQLVQLLYHQYGAGSSAQQTTLTHLLHAGRDSLSTQKRNETVPAALRKPVLHMRSLCGLENRPKVRQ